MKKWNDVDFEQLKELYSNTSNKDLALLLNSTKSTVQAYAKRFNLKKSADFIASSNSKAGTLTQRTYKLNDSFFEVIDSKPKAYILGILWSDGFITKTGSVGITLSLKDKEILENILKYTESTYPIYVGKNKDSNNICHDICGLSFRSSKMISDLKNYGIRHGKTYSLDVPINIPTEYIWHFIRGFFDGDGCVTGRDKSHAKICIVGTKQICEWLKYTIGIGNIYSKNNSTICYSYEFCGAKQIKYFVDKLYQDSSNINLSRKYNKFKELEYLELNC